jgi:pyruvate dehydrogenase E2 component (dihydrolipoamide acetyltransferase)
MMQDVRVPEIGEHIESGEVVKVLVAVGDVVTVDQPLAELETDKAVVEFPSPVAGRVTKVLMRAGEKVSIGQVVLQVESSATVVPPGGPVRETASPPRASGGAKGLRDGEPERGSPTGRPPVLPPSLSPLATTSDAEVAASPAVRRLARELGVWHEWTDFAR